MINKNHSKAHALTILAVILDYAPTLDASDLMVDIWEGLAKAYEPGQNRDLALCAILYDGLQHGNWPWNVLTSGVPVQK